MREVLIRDEKLRLSPISAYDAARGVALSRKTAAALEKICPCDTQDLSDGACILYLSLYRGGRRRFPSPMAVLRTLSVEEVRAAAGAYRDMMGEVEKDGVL